MSPDTRLALALGLLLAIAAGCLTLAGVARRRALVTASVRAAVQLTVVGLVVRAVFAAPAASAGVIALMLAVASWTAAGRLRRLPNAGRAVLLACALGAGVTLGVLFAVPALADSVRYLVAIGGIVLGGTMTACTIAGRRLLDALDRRRDEVEGWLAIGATPRQAVRDLARTAITEALLPALDQTRTVGLVTLPGAFVGALLGGASPATAARFQLVVLVSLLAAETIAAVVLIGLLGAPERFPPEVAPARAWPTRPRLPPFGQRLRARN